MKGIIVILLLAFTLSSTAQSSMADAWADSVLSTLTTDQKIGQLFMIRAHSDLGPKHILGVKNQIKRFEVGGLCFFQGTPQRQVQLINDYQQLSRIPLLIAMDAEWGPGMRFKEAALSFPRQLMLGAIQDNTLIYEFGRAVADQLRVSGTHVNFAPVVDVNNNPLNPVINDRSFGEDRYNVTAKSYQYMRGMQDGNILTCAKHFPGHGDTDVDSHLDLPVIRHSRARLDSIELYPFKALIDKGVESVMVAHLSIPALDPAVNVPTTLSKPVVTELLRKDLGFEGLIFTDALEMKGVTKHFKPGEVELLAIEAGNDILTLPERIDQSIVTLREAIEDGRITVSQLNTHVRRILKAKYQYGLAQFEPLQNNPELFEPSARALKSRLIEAALTGIANDRNLLPLNITAGQTAGSLMIGAEGISQFQRRLTSYGDIRHIAVTQSQLLQRRESLFPALRLQDVVIVGLSGMNKYAQKDFGLRPETITFLRQLNRETNVVLVVFGSPYSLKFFEEFDQVILAYQDDQMIQDIAAQAVFGAIPLKGRLPVTASEKYGLNHGIQIKHANRLGYAIPERVGMSSDTLQKIKGIVQDMIRDKAAPGCQVFVARDGKVVYNESFGHHTYARSQRVKTSDLYDIASITKVLATTAACMRLKDEGKLDISKTLGEYLPELKGTNKEDLVIADVLAHEAGLKSWIPFYEETVSGSRSNPVLHKDCYSSQSSRDYSVPVARNIFMREAQIDTMWKKLIETDLRQRKDYRYSDLGFYFLASVIERITGQSLDAYCDKTFYQPLGISRVTFTPLLKFGKESLVPTEEDRYFRKQRLQGHVHDAGAAMMGGVAGHAGLFGTAEELGVIMQMLMNEGGYGGRKYFNARTVREFTQRYNNSTRRGLGFDMKQLDRTKKTYTSSLASSKTYGHTGFTGTCVWNDPASKLTYVFLSNRTYPTMRNNKLNEEEVRERIHSLLYRAIH